MKTHTKNLLIASLVYAGAFIVLLIAAMAGDFGIGLFYDEETINPDTLIFFASLFFMMLAAWAAYFVFYLLQRRIANNDVNAKFLGIGPRILGAVIGSVIAGGILFACMFWISDEGEEISILAANTVLFGISIGVAAVVSFVNFIVFKPRA